MVGCTAVASLLRSRLSRMGARQIDLRMRVWGFAPSLLLFGLAATAAGLLTRFYGRVLNLNIGIPLSA